MFLITNVTRSSFELNVSCHALSQLGGASSLAVGLFFMCARARVCEHVWKESDQRPFYSPASNLTGIHI